MTVRKTLCLVASALLAWAGVSAPARAGVFIGVGVPGPYYRGYYRPYYGPRVIVGVPPIVVAPAPPPVVVAPVYAAPAPVVVAPAAVPVYAAPPAAPVAVPPPAPLPPR